MAWWVWCHSDVPLRAAGEPVSLVREVAHAGVGDFRREGRPGAGGYYPNSGRRMDGVENERYARARRLDHHLDDWWRWRVWLTRGAPNRRRRA